MTSGAFAAATILAVVTGAQAVPEREPTPVVQGLVKPTIAVPSTGQQDPFDKIVLTTQPGNVSRSWVNIPTTPQWRVECGIKVIVVNPDIDPKMIVTPPPGAAEAKIRRIAPPPCPERDSTKEVGAR
jgi:hypothetical protein